ncbi:FHA domain-containing protein [Microbacterium karelineae]|uniref:FHA domain-containing protein n=1 Tax=Microbacterium karelineae TaxID=2654283 RepID=UPI0018D2F5D5|nr:FHA domain-containing protein [Microbacterium karelineae]
MSPRVELVLPDGSRISAAGDVEMGRDVGDGRISAALSGFDGVSRRHAVISIRADGVWVRDAGSTNGTFLDGRPVRTESRVAGRHATVGLGRRAIVSLVIGDER